MNEDVSFRCETCGEEKECEYELSHWLQRKGSEREGYTLHFCSWDCLKAYVKAHSGDWEIEGLE